MSDIYIELAEEFELWKNNYSDIYNSDWSLEDAILAWADNTETDLEDIDIDILCDTILGG